ncbi:MAG TPA: hypothetical protein H9672_00480 [Firmicutes bacterium]|nr:hypothetical protein [Bacillota bacterium]
MNYSDFLSQIRCMVQSHMGSQAAVSIQPVLKNNNLRLDGLLILNPGENISPTIYLNHYYEEYLDGTSMQDIIKDIELVYETHRCPAAFDTDIFRDFRRIRHKIAFRLINLEANPDLLADLPHIPFLDLAIVFYFTIENDFIGSSTALIHNNHMELWKTSPEELYSLALQNTRSLFGCEIRPMEQLIREMTGQSLPLPSGSRRNSDFLYVLTNRDRIYGASCILYRDILEQFAKQVESSFYILPSSIHEVILISAERSPSPQSLQQMVHEINQTELAAEEILSDNVYLYRTDTKELELAAPHTQRERTSR